MNRTPINVMLFMEQGTRMAMQNQIGNQKFLWFIHKWMNRFKGRFRAGSVAPERDSVGAQYHEQIRNMDD